MSFDTFIKSQLYRKKSNNLNRLGFDFTKDPKQEYLKIQSTLYSLYHIQLESTVSIKYLFNIPSGKTVDTIFKLFDIETRSLSSAGLLSYEKGRTIPGVNPTFKFTWHTTWDNKEVFLRSNDELVLAKQLDDCKVVYFTESLRIKYFDTQKQRYRIAVPDFYLPDTHEIVEVKSTYWYDETNMKDKVLSYSQLGYKFRLFLDMKFII